MTASERAAWPAPARCRALLDAPGKAETAVATAARHAAEPPRVARAARAFALGVHHPSYVLAGAALGWAFGGALR